MQVSDAMTRDVQMVKPNQNITEAAKMMADSDCGVLPVADNEKLVGMITDRDIVVRALAQGKAADTKIDDVMSHAVMYCFEEDELDKVARNMSDLQIRRLPVLNSGKRLVGIVSLGDIALADQTPGGEALHGISGQKPQQTQS